MPEKQKFIGRYTVSEYAMVKQQMIRSHDELKPYKVDEVCRYIATKDWPSERRMSYMYAKNDNDFSAGFLRIYDECQELFDKVHHGESFLRFYPKIHGVPESDREFPDSLVEEALVAGTYTGPVPSKFHDLVKER